MQNGQSLLADPAVAFPQQRQNAPITVQRTRNEGYNPTEGERTDYKSKGPQTF